MSSEDDTGEVEVMVNGGNGLFNVDTMGHVDAGKNGGTTRRNPVLCIA